jgi:hypothetical protein
MQTQPTSTPRALLAKLPLPSSTICVAVLTVVACLPAVPSPPLLAAFAVDRALGTVLYLATVVGLATCYVAAQKREDAARDAAQRARDDAGAQRHAEDLAATAQTVAVVQRESDKLYSAVISMSAQIASGARADSPQVREIVESARTSAVTIKEFVSPVLPGVISYVVDRPVSSASAQPPFPHTDEYDT